MTNPLGVDCSADAWTKVASGVTDATVWLISGKPHRYYITYRDAGDTAPTTLADAIGFDTLDEEGSFPSMPVSSGVPVDVYIWAAQDAGRVRVDVGTGIGDGPGVAAGYDAVSGTTPTSEGSPAHTWGPIGPEELITAAQDLTASWADLGDEIEMGGYTELLAWLTIDINNSLDVRVRALVKHTQGGAEEFLLPIQTIGASSVKVEGHYYEFNVDADQLMVLPFHLPNDVPFVQLQVMAGTVGATAGQIDAAEITRSWAGGGDGD
jgi:hypothetical protein